MKVHYFNPGYEAAVEQGNFYYTAPRMVQSLRKDLQTLPIYYADKDEQVFIATQLPMELMCGRFFTDASLVTELSPWGWAPDLKATFPNLELPYSLDEMRRLGSRSLSLELWNRVYHHAPDLFRFAPPVEVFMGAHVEQGNWVLKEEFSSSGRGVEFITEEQDPNVIIQRRIGKQRGRRLFLEPFYHIEEERGYEFWRTKEGSIKYLGCQRAITEHRRYGGSRLGPLPMDDQGYVDALLPALTQLPLGAYSGVIGVDTALYLNGGIVRFVPCLEVNVRPTMGYVAITLQRDWLFEGQRGTFLILTKGDAQLQSLVTTQPLYLSDNMEGLSPGLYLLTPLLKDSYFVACLKVD